MRFFPYIAKIFLLFLALGWSVGTAAALDSYQEDFDGRTLDATINGVASFQVTAGASSNAVVQSSVTPAGAGKALKVAGASTPVTVARDASYGNLSPTWVRFLMRPGVGGERRTAPTSGIAAVSFDFSGAILASDGTRWVDTGKSYTADKWWEVMLKLNFTNHTYDLYLIPSGASSSSFTPVKTGLKFIDSSKNSLGTVQFGGAYNAQQSSDTYLDELTVLGIDRVEFISAAQTVLQGQVSGPVTVQLQNNLREPQRAVQDIALELKSTSAQGRFSLKKEPWSDIVQVVVPKEASSATFYYKDGKVGEPVLSAKEFPDWGWLAGLQQQKVLAQAAHFEVLATAVQTAGKPFPVTITARTEEGVVDESYNGTVGVGATYVNPSSGTLRPTPEEAGGFSKGKLELSVSYADAGAIQIKVTDKTDSSKTGSSGQILVLPAKLTVEADSPQVVGRAFGLTVTALNFSDQATPNYQGPVNLGVQAISPTTGTGALSPASSAGFEGGKAMLQVSYPRWGSLHLTAADAVVSTVTGQSGAVTFYPASLRVQASLPPPPRDFFYTDEMFDLEVAPLASSGETIPNYRGTFGIDASSGFGLPRSYAFTAQDSGVHRFVLSVGLPGTYLVQATEADAGLASPPLSVTIKQAFLKVVSTVAPVGKAAEVTILLVDENGKIIKSESSTTLNVKLIESNPNSSAGSSALGQAVKLTEGKAIILVQDSESETVTVVPTSLFGIRAQAGTVNFGRFSPKGVGVLMWREIQEEN